MLIILCLCVIVQTFKLLKPAFIERRQIDIAFAQRLNYFNKEKLAGYASEGIEMSIDKKFTIQEPGRIVLNIPMIEGVDYAIQLQLGSLNEKHIVCIGIGSEGFIAAEVLGIEETERSNYQLGYCSDGTRSTKYSDMYTNFEEFDIYGDDVEFDEQVYTYGESVAGNKFGDQPFYMIIKDNQLVYMDNHENLFAIYNNIDRRRTFVPVITMHLRDQLEVENVDGVDMVVEELQEHEHEHSFIQLVGQMNPFKHPPGTQSNKPKWQQREGEQQKQQDQETELAKLANDKLMEGQNKTEDEGTDGGDEGDEIEDEDEVQEDISEQAMQARRTEQTKQKHEEAQAGEVDEQVVNEDDEINQAEVEGMEDEIDESKENIEESDIFKDIEQTQQQVDVEQVDVEQQSIEESTDKQKYHTMEPECIAGDERERLEQELIREEKAEKDKLRQQEKQSKEIEKQKALDELNKSTEIQFKNAQSHTINPTLFSKQLIPLRSSMTVSEQFTVYQDNTKLPYIFQDYQSCSYAYLSVEPTTTNFHMQVQIDNLDDLYDKYAIGVGVYAWQMLDRLRGWRNTQDQLWCLDKDSEDLWQYGALYRSDGTFIDSYMLGEYFKYKVNKEAVRSTKINVYFTHKNRVAFTFDDEKTVILACVNPKLKHFVPIIELKAYKGLPSVTILDYQTDVEIPFNFTDTQERIDESFNKTFKLMDKYFVEKRGSFNEDDDDYTLQGNGGESTSMNMWDTRLFDAQYEWWVKIDELSELDDLQICIGINQMSSEQLIEDILFKKYKAQVAYICDRSDFIHTFFQECPVNENPIIFVSGTVIRFKLSDYFLEAHDGYNTVLFSLRRTANTGVVPSVVIRGNSTNKVTFLKGPSEFGPNPILKKVDIEDIKYEQFATFDIFTFPILDKASTGLLKPDTDKPLITKDIKPLQVTKKLEPAIGRLHEPVQKPEAQPKQETQAPQSEQVAVIKTDKKLTLEDVRKLTVCNVPEEMAADQTGNTSPDCIIIFEHCHYEGQHRLLYPHRLMEEPPYQFRSLKLCRKTLKMTIIQENKAHVQDVMEITHDIECMPSPINVEQIILK